MQLIQPALKPGGLILVGEPYWLQPPTDEVLASIEFGADDYTSLLGTMERIESAGLELVEMVLANGDSWDRYVASQWRTIDSWLRANPEDPDAAGLRAWNEKNRRSYLAYERDLFGWGVFVTRMK